MCVRLKWRIMCPRSWMYASPAAPPSLHSCSWRKKHRPSIATERTAHDPSLNSHTNLGSAAACMQSEKLMSGYHGCSRAIPGKTASVLPTCAPISSKLKGNRTRHLEYYLRLAGNCVCVGAVTCEHDFWHLVHWRTLREWK